MAARLINPMASSQLAALLGVPLQGPDLMINCVASLGEAGSQSLVFAKASTMTNLEGAIVLAPPDQITQAGAAFLLVPKPRMAFARALNLIVERGGFARPEAPPEIHPTAVIGQHCVFGNGVRIGPNCVIGNHVTLGDSVVIGARSVIKSCAVIGEDGFGFERDDNGLPIRLVHLGSVVIGEDAEVGCFTTVCRGTLSNTIIENHAKVDDHVHVAHNVEIRRGAMVIACAELSGGVELGEMSWVGPNATVIQQVKIGRNAMVGIGANVLKHVADDSVVAGNPAKPLHPKATA